MDFDLCRGIGGGSMVPPSYEGGALGGGGLKRQQQIQHALILRSVKQRTSTISPLPFLLDLSPSVDIERGDAESGSETKSTMRDCLQELERQLLDDDDDEEAEASGSGSGSAVTAADLGETMNQLSSLSTPSPTNSSSSSSASCAPGSRQLLLDAAAAVSEGNLEVASANLAILKRAANQRGDPEQRLTAMMVEALQSRINPTPPGIDTAAEIAGVENQAATQLLYDLSPCFKLALLAANLAILEATRDSPKIHIVDLDVGLGGQYPALIHAFAEQHRRNTAGGGRGSPLAVKITAVSLDCNGGGANHLSNLRIVGDRLASLAERVGVALRFSIVSRRPAELDRASLGCEPGEALAVNLAFQLSRVADESVSPANPRDEVLRRVRGLAPRVVAVTEQEVSLNTAPFAARFAAACAHYGAVLESLDVAAARESAERARVEGCLARKVANSVAAEGEERVERCEVFGKWRARIAMAGLRPMPVGPAVVDRLGSYVGKPGISMKEENGGLCFGWMGRVITVSSTWH